LVIGYQGSAALNFYCVALLTVPILLNRLNLSSLPRAGKEGMQLLHEIKNSLLHLVFPHVCQGCGSDVLDVQNELCLKCLDSLPGTNFHMHPDNPMEKIFWGRVPVTHATAQYYFTKESLMQQLLYQLKYRGNRELGIYLGRLMGYALASSTRFSFPDALIPLPLFPAKEKKRGYNQATVLCEGIAQVLQKPVFKDVVRRLSYTDSQTRKNRIERWLNMEGRFELVNSKAIEGKHVLLVDDVITTGATLEACGREIVRAQNVQLSIATLCFSSGN
jgi:ComF family protein